MRERNGDAVGLILLRMDRLLLWVLFFFRDFDMNLRLGGEKFATAQACEIHRSDCIKDGEDDDIERKGKSDVCYCRKEQASNQASKLNGK